MSVLPEFFKHDVLGDIPIEYSSRRTRAAIGLQIVDNKCVIVLKLPECQRFKIDDLRDFIDKNASWLKRKKTELAAQLVVHSYEIGDKFFYLGNEYELRQGTKSCFDGKNFYVSTHSIALNKREIKKIYKQLAENFIVPLCRQYASDFGLTIGKIRISNAAKRWGSCNSKGDLNFAMHLVMCPEEFIRHTICHELAHRLHMNHSKAFYAALHRFYPYPVPIIDQWKYRPLDD